MEHQHRSQLFWSIIFTKTHKGKPINPLANWNTNNIHKAFEKQSAHVQRNQDYWRDNDDACGAPTQCKVTLDYVKYHYSIVRSLLKLVICGWDSFSLNIQIPMEISDNVSNIVSREYMYQNIIHPIWIHFLSRNYFYIFLLWICVIQRYLLLFFFFSWLLFLVLIWIFKMIAFYLVSHA